MGRLPAVVDTVPVYPPVELYVPACGLHPAVAKKACLAEVLPLESDMVYVTPLSVTVDEEFPVSAACVNGTVTVGSVSLVFQIAAYNKYQGPVDAVPYVV